jgi:maltodextrin utilization protein YvdJ
MCFFTFLTKANYFNEVVNGTELSPSVSAPWYNSSKVDILTFSLLKISSVQTSAVGFRAKKINVIGIIATKKFRF